MKDKKQTNKRRGFSVKAFAIPLLLFVVVMHISLVLIVIDINHSSNKLFDLMERSGDYQIDATGMQASNTILSETCNVFIQRPTTDETTTNSGPLLQYANELVTDPENRRSPKIAERFRSYDVSYDVLYCVEKASEYSEQIIETQLHAIALMASIYPLPSTSEFDVFSQVVLSEEELAKTNDEKIAIARTLVTESSYANKRRLVSENITKCNRLIQKDFSRASTKTKRHVNKMRNILWCEISLIVLILSGAYVIFYLSIVRPLRIYSKTIKENRNIKNYGRITEMRQLVDSFNGLWDYRNKLEEILRTEAENDALTGLPNRYCMERDLLKNDNNDKPFSVLMFDVNFLKRTNDTKGHLAGDQLIRTAASCIKECFGQNGGNNCYRIGGDEFVAVIKGVSKEEIKRRIDKFNLALIRENISISVGFAHTEKADADSFKALLAEADKNMYRQKKIAHNLSKQNKKD